MKRVSEIIGNLGQSIIDICMEMDSDIYGKWLDKQLSEKRGRAYKEYKEYLFWEEADMKAGYDEDEDEDKYIPSWREAVKMEDTYFDADDLKIKKLTKENQNNKGEKGFQKNENIVEDSGSSSDNNKKPP